MNKTKKIIKEFKNEGYEISVYSNGILIKATDYHPLPLLLDEKKLKSLCIHMDKRKTKKLERWKKEPSK